MRWRGGGGAIVGGVKVRDEETSGSVKTKKRPLTTGLLSGPTGGFTDREVREKVGRGGGEGEAGGEWLKGRGGGRGVSRETGTKFVHTQCPDHAGRAVRKAVPVTSVRSVPGSYVLWSGWRADQSCGAAKPD